MITLVKKRNKLSVSEIKSVSTNKKRSILFGPDNYRSAFLNHYFSSDSEELSDTARGYAIELLEKAFPKKEINRATALEMIKSLFTKQASSFPEPEEHQFTFVDLFAGIGGFRIAMQRNGGKCIFSSEWDKKAQETYYANFGEIPFGDITKEETKEWIPDEFDVLCGGFPCQPFSLAGVSKKNALGRKHGFEDERQGNLFFHIADILEKHRPKAFFLENVKNLMSHDKGNTFKVIKNTLLDLDYSFDSNIVDGKYFVPQHRERTFMIGFDKRYYGPDKKFDFPQMPTDTHMVRNILENNVDPKYTLTDNLWIYLQEYAQKHREKGNGFGYGLVNLDGISRTMSARYYKDGAEILIPQGNGNPRRLTPREAASLQGYPANFNIVVSDAAAYKQFGNSVVVPLIQTIGAAIAEKLPLDQ